MRDAQDRQLIGRALRHGKRYFLLLAVVSGAVSLLAGCAGAPAPDAGGPPSGQQARPAPAEGFMSAPDDGAVGTIVIGTSAAFTGPSRGLGIELYRGAMAYLQQVNSTGGINGKRVVVKAYDDGYDPTPAVENTISLVEKDNVLLLTGYVGTPTTTRVLPLLKRYQDRGVYFFFPFTGAQPQREAPYDEFAFNLRASYRQETEGLVNNLVASGRTRIAVFYQADAYGRSGWDGVKRALVSRGLKVVAEATYRRGTPFSHSMRQQVDILRQAGADAVISIGAYEACAAFIRDARDAGWDVPIANVSFVGSESLLDLLIDSGRRMGRDYTSNLINSQVVPSYEDTSLPAIKEYRELMDTYNTMPPAGLMKEDYRPLKYSFVSLEGYLNARVLAKVLEGVSDPSSVTLLAARASVKRAAEGVANLDIGLDRPVSFGRLNHQGLDRVYYTAVKDGRFLPIRDWR